MAGPHSRLLTGWAIETGDTKKPRHVIYAAQFVDIGDDPEDQSIFGSKLETESLASP
jgi:hypothetical protein